MSGHPIHGRGENSRGTSVPLRGSFDNPGASRIPLAAAARINRAADLARDTAVRLYEKNHDTRLAEAHTRLLRKVAPTQAFSPSGVATDPKSLLMARAHKELAYRHGQRLLRIEEAQKSMLVTGKLRANRDLQWDGKQRKIEPRTKDMSRSSEARGPSRKERSVNAKIATAQERARSKAETHVAKHREKWADLRYSDLASTFDLSNGKASNRTPDLRTVAREIAQLSVTIKLESRLKKIDRACENMRSSRQVRESRPAGRNVGLER